MASTSVSKIIPAPPDRVWQLIGGFDSLPDWLPFIPSSTPQEGGRVRRLNNPDGEVILERLIDFSETDRYYSYAILQAPFPVGDYLSTLRVHTVAGKPDESEVQWSGRFTAVNASEDDVIALFTGIYQDGLDALHKALS
ncbi:SRPBCC family protein [Streptomyces sp. NPDC095817]|uniref:SRPBCC family protein n=1 Tax=Streptomyces sp. NPDC095817 TaxID=3155082 RepID=UPI003324FE60